MEQKMSNFIELFKKHVSVCSDKTAIIFHEAHLTYKELDHKSDALARYIVSCGVNTEEIIPLILERTIDLIVAMVAVLKSGCAFLPISPISPCSRIKYIFEDTRAKLVLSNINIAHLTHADMKVINPTDFCEIDARIPSFQTPHQLSYVMYTSGSTGDPKGVLIEHHSMMNLFLSLIADLNITNKEVFLALTDYTFDISLIELLMPLLCGATIVLTEQGTVADGVKIKEYLKKHPITFMQATPLSWRVLLKQGWENEGAIKILVGGELFTTKMAEQLNYHKGNVWNVYGPTETTMWSMANHLKEKLYTESVPLGFPLNNTVIRVLDDTLKQVEIGAQGELYIAGVGLARGYLNNVELTHQKFIIHPETHERLYKTGDLVFIHDEKTICYIGRIDTQLKYGGIRIEASEIERAIEQEPFVKKAVVKVHEVEDFYKSLAAYVEIDEEKVFSDEIFSVASDTVKFLKNIYDETYLRADNYESESVNNCGWQSSFTGRLISAAELDESYQFIRQVINTSDLDDVLEVGCGTGSLLFEYLDNVNKCTIIELSSKAIEYVKSKLSKAQQEKVIFKNESIQNVHQHHQKYTCVIVNSVVQYLPSIHSLVTTITQLVAASKTNGTIIIGDVRSMELLDVYFLEKIRANHTPGDDLDSELSAFYYKSRDAEIALSPQFFFVLKTLIKGISHVDINVKQGVHKNELNYFRYDVVIHVGKHVVYQLPLELDCEVLLQEQSLLDKIESCRDIPIIVRKIPNFHLEDILTKIDSEIPNHPLFNSDKLKVVDIEAKSQVLELLKLKFKGRETFLFYDKSNHLNRLDMHIYPIVIDSMVRCLDIEEYGDYRAYCKEPFNPWIQKFCFEHIKLKIKQHILSWVSPSVYVWVEKWPVTINGKLDRKKLLLPMKIDLSEPVEKTTLSKLEAIWRNITGDYALVDKEFWVHGVSSLCMYFFLATINETFQVGINYHEFHNYNTLEKLSIYIDELVNPS
jgi:amino acid adenylation domain-containing protein